MLKLFFVLMSRIVLFRLTSCEWSLLPRVRRCHAVVRDVVPAVCVQHAVGFVLSSVEAGLFEC